MLAAQKKNLSAQYLWNNPLFFGKKTLAYKKHIGSIRGRWAWTPWHIKIPKKFSHVCVYWQCRYKEQNSPFQSSNNFLKTRFLCIEILRNDIKASLREMSLKLETIHRNLHLLVNSISCAAYGFREVQRSYSNKFFQQKNRRKSLDEKKPSNTWGLRCCIHSGKIPTAFFCFFFKLIIILAKWARTVLSLMDILLTIKDSQLRNALKTPKLYFRLIFLKIKIWTSCIFWAVRSTRLWMRAEHTTL